MKLSTSKMVGKKTKATRRQLRRQDTALFPVGATKNNWTMFRKHLTKLSEIIIVCGRSHKFEKKMLNNEKANIFIGFGKRLLTEI